MKLAHPDNGWPMRTVFPTVIVEPTNSDNWWVFQQFQTFSIWFFNFCRTLQSPDILIGKNWRNIWKKKLIASTSLFIHVMNKQKTFLIRHLWLYYSCVHHLWLFTFPKSLSHTEAKWDKDPNPPTFIGTPCDKISAGCRASRTWDKLILYIFQLNAENTRTLNHLFLREEPVVKLC